ncbi:MAG TPA: hypothetical protein ENK80_02075 [Rhodobacterales bacterium]|nr:hypothetical protein [Rhodobacterales bacterium]
MLVSYLFWLAVLSIIDTPSTRSAWYAYGAMPLIGVLVTLTVVGFFYEVFARDLPFVLDTLRFGLRRVLPRRWARPASAWLTRQWQRMPVGLREASPWMPDDEPFETPGKHAARGERHD